MLDILLGKQGSGGTGLFGTLLGSIFGGGSIAGAPSTPSFVGTGYYHQGGIVGASSVPSRPMPASLFAHAPRLHNGLAPDMKPDEFPAILQRGERVMPKGGGGEANVQVNVINNGDGEVSSRERRGSGGGRIVDVVIDAVRNDLARGGFDGAMQGRFGARPVVAGRSGG